MCTACRATWSGRAHTTSAPCTSSSCATAQTTRALGGCGWSWAGSCPVTRCHKRINLVRRRVVVERRQRPNVWVGNRPVRGKLEYLDIVHLPERGHILDEGRKVLCLDDLHPSDRGFGWFCGIDSIHILGFFLVGHGLICRRH